MRRSPVKKVIAIRVSYFGPRCASSCKTLALAVLQSELIADTLLGQNACPGPQANHIPSRVGGKKSR